MHLCEWADVVCARVCGVIPHTHLLSSTKNGPPMHHFGRIRIERRTRRPRKYRCTAKYTANLDVRNEEAVGRSERKERKGRRKKGFQITHLAEEATDLGVAVTALPTSLTH